MTVPGAPRLLLVEDDAELAGMLRRLLSSEGYQVEVAPDGQAGLHLGLTRRYDLVVLDRGLPAIEGLDLLGRLRRRGFLAPVLVLTARGAVADRVAGLDAGAEDYLVKPFDLEELLARLRALLRRHADTAEAISLGAAVLELGDRSVRLPDGPRVELSGREFELLRQLALRPTRVFTREELRERVFDRADSDSIVDTYVYYLRRKLGGGSIQTVRGVGYRMGIL